MQKDRNTDIKTYKYADTQTRRRGHQKCKGTHIERVKAIFWQKNECSYLWPTSDLNATFMTITWSG